MARPDALKALWAARLLATLAIHGNFNVVGIAESMVFHHLSSILQPLGCFFMLPRVLQAVYMFCGKLLFFYYYSLLFLGSFLSQLPLGWFTHGLLSLLPVFRAVDNVPTHW